MGELEKKATKRLKRGKVESAFLGALILTGVTFVALAAPNTLKLLKYIDPDWSLKRDPKRRLREVAYRLKKKGLVEFKNEDGRVCMRITPKGKKMVDRAALFGVQKQKPKDWDGFWRIVIFDIPEKRRRVRVQVRELVQSFGFVRLQDSVWIYPYECEELITLLKSDLKIGSDLRYIIASAIENDSTLCKQFGIVSQT